ncbi:transcription factor bHLH18-like isoform X2 [Lotus japonicus]|uniref:transcription factor bHLH18-like isoform X2 n=1 Tax=Lotus japonicus TaxID=34305 RepID=UPI00258A8EDC|nr:transcription factor bHLH18-like isoform X2 [Lotus japonicus]
MEDNHTPMDASVASWLSDFEIDDHTLFPDECHHLNLLVVDDKEFLSNDDIASVLQKQTLQQSLSSDCTSITLSNSFTDETSFDFADTPSITENFSPELSPSSSISSFKSQILFLDNTNSSPATNTTTQISGFDSSTLNPKQNETVLVPLPQLGNTHISTQNSKGSSKNQNFETKSSHGKRSPAHHHDHIMAERKRREKLSQSFIALAALVPGLKKMDKSSVLTDAIKYVKELKERLAVLEEQSKKTKVESVVVPINKPAPELCGGDNDDESLVQVESRVSEQDMLIRILCKKQKRLLTKILAEIQSFQLSVVNSSILPFGDSMDITIIAQMGEGYDLTAKELVKKLRVAILKFMS